MIGRFGPSEFAARDALRAIQDSRFNEFCMVGSAGVTFFLVDGKAPTRVPYHVQGRRFDPNALKVAKHGEKWAITANNSHLLECRERGGGRDPDSRAQALPVRSALPPGSDARVGVSFFAKGR